MPKSIEQLLDEVKAAKRIEKKKKREPMKITHVAFPDALILCTINITCASCGVNHRSPNPKLMLRYNKHITKVENWASIYNVIPREHVIRSELSQACENCFTTNVWETPTRADEDTSLVVEPIGDDRGQKSE